MSLLALHHVSIITADLGKSLPFYRDAFGLTEIARPSFSVSGAWLACGDLQVHLVEYPEGTSDRTLLSIVTTGISLSARTISTTPSID